MSDQHSLDYTINDPSEVKCPFCGATREYDDQQIGELSDAVEGFLINCENCGREMLIKISTDVTVLAWKPEALQ